jgi:hypothetical protein
MLIRAVRDEVLSGLENAAKEQTSLLLQSMNSILGLLAIAESECKENAIILQRCSPILTS